MAQQHSRSQAESLPELSIIIPALNEADELDATLHAIARLRGHKEVIVVDGGSQDTTVQIARRHGACVIREQGGRGRQLHAGASLAMADILWFLHADTIPPANAVEHIKEALQGPDIVGGCFAVTFAGSTFSARFLTCTGSVSLHILSVASIVRSKARCKLRHEQCMCEKKRTSAVVR